MYESALRQTSSWSALSVDAAATPQANLDHKDLQWSLYNPDDFTNREDVLQLIRDRIELGQSNESTRWSVLMITGVDGSGKSWLLRHVTTLYEFGLSKSHKRGTLAAYADLEICAERAKNDDLESKTCLVAKLEEMVTQLLATLEKHKAVSTKIKRHFEIFHRENNRSVETQTKNFVELIKELATAFVPVLAFDSLELADADTTKTSLLEWFEENVIAPLVRKDQVLILLGSRRELRRLRLFEVRRRTKLFELSALPRESAQALYPYAFGHPWTTRYLQSRLGFYKTEQLDNFLSEPEQQKLLSQLLDAVRHHLFRGISSELSWQIEIAATLRFFHIRSLQLILTEVMEDEGQKRILEQQSDLHFRSLIGKMVDTDLVRWSTEHRGYQVEPTVRRILNQALHLRSKAEFSRRHELAFQLYQQWIREAPFAGERFLIEAIYHRHEILQIDHKLDQARQDIQGLIEQIFPVGQNQIERIDTTQESLRHDEDLKESPLQLVLTEWLNRVTTG
jgi:hypothetical protein